MSKRKIVIATHGTLAEGFKSALQIIAGAENVEAFNCYTSPDFNLQETIQKIMNITKEEIKHIDIYDYVDKNLNDYLKNVFNGENECNRFGCTNCMKCENALNSIITNEDNKEKWSKIFNDRIKKFRE